MTPDLLRHLKHEEGFVGHAYRDQAGYPTIGYGHLLHEMTHDTMTEPEAEALLIQDVAKHEAAALRLSPGLKDEPTRRLDAITAFCFNLGSGHYAGSVLRLRVNQRKWAEAGAQMRLWCHARDPKTGKLRILSGLVDRREVEARWLEEPIDRDVLPPAA